MVLFMFIGRRFHYAIYELRHIGVIQETGETTTEFVFVFIAAVIGRMDLYGHCLFGCICFTFHFGSVITIVLTNELIKILNTFA